MPYVSPLHPAPPPLPQPLHILERRLQMESSTFAIIYNSQRLQKVSPLPHLANLWELRTKGVASKAAESIMGLLLLKTVVQVTLKLTLSI